MTPNQTMPIDAKAFNLFDIPEAYYLDPLPYFKALRDEDPIHRNLDGSVLLTRYEDIISVWRDLSGVVNREEAYTKKFGQGPLLEHHTTSMLFRDPPDHDRLRAVVNPFFSQKSIERLRQATVEIVDKLLLDIEKKRDIDFIHDFSSKIPVQLVCDIFGVPREEGPIIRDLGAQVLLPLNPTVTQEVNTSINGAKDPLSRRLQTLSAHWLLQKSEVRTFPRMKWLTCVFWFSTAVMKQRPI